MKSLYDAFLGGVGLMICWLLLVALLWLAATVIVWIKNHGRVKENEVSDWVQYIIIGVAVACMILGLIFALVSRIKG